MKRRRGFSLVEVMLAVGLIALVAGLTFGLLVEMGARERDVREHAARLAQTGELFEIVERALAGSMVATGEASPGISGGGGELKIVHRGVGPAGDDAMLDLVALALRWDAASGSIACDHALIGGEGGEHETLVEGVSFLSVRFFAGSRWHGTFDSAAEGELPAAIEVALWFGPPPNPADLPHTPRQDPMDADNAPAGFAEMFGEEFEATGPGLDRRAAPAPPLPTRAPDRRRIFAVPDAPRAAPGVSE